MKRMSFIGIGVALALSSALWGQSITVTSPVAGAQWCQGSSHAITWTSSGVAGPLSIKLRLAGAPDAPPVLDIVASTANDGTESWLVPATLAPGNYLVRVRTVSDAPLVYDDSDSFEVKACPPAGVSITVTAPTSGTTWNQENSYAVTWVSSGVSGPLSIKLRNANPPDAPPMLDIAASTANDGSESWLIPAATVVPSGNYVIRVRTVSESPLVYGDSPSFHIGSSIPFPHDWFEKRYLEVRWPPDPDPCLCPEWNIEELLERIRKIDPRFIGSLGLLMNGQKIMDLGALGGGRALANIVKPTLSRRNFDAFRKGTAKFSMGLFDAKGVLLQEIELKGGAQLLR